MTEEIEYIEKINIHKDVDDLELELRQYAQTRCKLYHLFTPGLYTRQIYMPERSLIVSKKHKTTHPFNVSYGSVLVKINDGQWNLIEAPYLSVTEPGTRRVLFVPPGMTCVWATSHPLSIVNGDENNLSELEQEDLLEEIENILIEKSENPLLQPMKQDFIFKKEGGIL